MSEQNDIDPFDTDAQEQRRVEQTEAERLRKLMHAEDLKWLMGNKQGRRVMMYLLEKHGVYRSSFRTNPYETAFLEGQRNEGLQLVEAIHEHAPERYAEMIREHRHGNRDIAKRASEHASTS